MNKKIQKNHKDTVFRFLFGRPEYALALYNSLNGTNYRDTGQLRYNTLENAIYMGMKNDISFVIAQQMNLYEHQSTVNPNMPLRDLFYIADLLQKEYRDRSVYSAKQIKIPAPQFVVFYNGREQMPERLELKLSDAYEIPSRDPSLELKVTVLNINPGMNEGLKEKCPILKEYVSFVEKVRTHAGQMEPEEAVELAVEECIRENILKDFLREQRSEVTMLSIYEYDEEKELELIRAEEREIGQQIGQQIGERRGREEERKRTMAEHEKHLSTTLTLCKEFGCSREQTVEKLMECCGLCREEALRITQ